MAAKRVKFNRSQSVAAPGRLPAGCNRRCDTYRNERRYSSMDAAVCLYAPSGDRAAVPVPLPVRVPVPAASACAPPNPAPHQSTPADDIAEEELENALENTPLLGIM